MTVLRLTDSSSQVKVNDGQWDALNAKTLKIIAANIIIENKFFAFVQTQLQEQ